MTFTTVIRPRYADTDQMKFVYYAKYFEYFEQARSELLRAKLRHAPVLRRAMDEGNWHILRLDALRRFAALPVPSLEGLQPDLGLDPSAAGPGAQLPLFEG